MTLQAADRVKVQWSGTGTSTITLGAAVTTDGGFQTVPAALDGRVVNYLIKHTTAQEAECGFGVYTASGNTLSRVFRTYPILGGAAVSFSAGVKEVSIAQLSTSAPYISTSDPTAADGIDAGFLAGWSRWLNTTTSTLWFCVDHSTGSPGAVWIQGGAAATGGHTIQEDATPLTARASLNFGTGLTASDDAGNARTNVVLHEAYLPGATANYRGAGNETLTAAFAALTGGIPFTEVDDATDYSATSFKVGLTSTANNEQRRFTGNQNHLLEFVAANLSDGDYGWLIKGGTGTVTLKYNDIPLNGGTSDIELKSKVKWTVHDGEVLIDGGTAEDVNMAGVAVVGNLAKVLTRGAASSQPTVNDSGAWIVTDGAITIPNVPGFHCTLEFGGDHDVTHNSLVWNTGAAAGEIVSVMVKPSNAIRITPKIAAADVINETDFV